MGDSYREEKKKHHTKSGFGPDPIGVSVPRGRSLPEERRALRNDYFAKSRKAKAAIRTWQRQRVNDY